MGTVGSGKLHFHHGRRVRGGAGKREAIGNHRTSTPSFPHPEQQYKYTGLGKNKAVQAEKAERSSFGRPL